MGLTLMNVKTKDYVDKDYFGDKNTPKHEFDPSKHIIPASAAKRDKGGNVTAPPDNAWFQDADAMARMRVTLKGQPKETQTAAWGIGGHFTPEGKWESDVEGKEKPTGYGAGAKESARQRARGYLDTLKLKENAYIDPETKTFNNESAGERAAIDSAYDTLLDSSERKQEKDPDYPRMARTAINTGSTSYRKKDPYWMLPLKEQLLRKELDDEAKAKQGQPQPGQPGAKPASAKLPSTPDGRQPKTGNPFLDADVEDAGKPPSRTEQRQSAKQIQYDAALDKIVQEEYRKFKKGMPGEKPETLREWAIQQAMLRFKREKPFFRDPGESDLGEGDFQAYEKRLRGRAAIQPPQQQAPQNPVQIAVPPQQPARPATAAIGSAAGGVVSPMRGMEPGGGIPGTLSRPLQTARGGFRPNAVRSMAKSDLVPG
jgi:hypothetical protein